MNENKKKTVLIAIIGIVVLVVVILSVIKVFGHINDSKVNDVKRETFKEEIQKIFNKATENANETLIASSPKGDTYCKKSEDLVGIELICPTDSKELDIDTNKSYLVITDSNGIVNYISVADNELVYGKTGVLSVDEIKKDYIYKIDDPSIKDKFAMVYGITPEGKVNSTDNSVK